MLAKKIEILIKMDRFEDHVPPSGKGKHWYAFMKIATPIVKRKKWITRQIGARKEFSDPTFLIKTLSAPEYAFRGLNFEKWTSSVVKFGWKHWNKMSYFTMSPRIKSDPTTMMANVRKAYLDPTEKFRKRDLDLVFDARKFLKVMHVSGKKWEWDDITHWVQMGREGVITRFIVENDAVRTAMKTKVGNGFEFDPMEMFMTDHKKP